MKWELLVKIGIVSSLLFLAGSCLSPIFSSARGNARRSLCLVNLKAIALACEQYRQDNDKTFPPLSNNKGQGWASMLQPYFKDWTTLQCKEGYEARSPRTTDYFFNAQLRSLKQGKVKMPEQTIAFGDGPDNGPTNSHLIELAVLAGEDESNFHTRHYGGANYAYADGHVKWLRPNKVTSTKPDALVSTFRPF